MDSQVKSAMLFAAGLGTRMRPLTDSLPKSLIEVGGTSMLSRALDWVESAGLTDIVVNTHWHAQQVIDHTRARNVVIQNEPHLLETGGGLKLALPHLGDPILTMNTDAVWAGPNPVELLIENWTPDDQALLLLAPRANSNFSMSRSGYLSRGGDWIYTGVQIIRPENVRKRPETVFSLNVVWDDLINANGLRGVPYSGEWCDVGTPQDIERAEKLLLKT